MNERYKIVRFYLRKQPFGYSHTIKRGLTLEQAQAHCQDPRTKGGGKRGPWFEGYKVETGK